MIIFFSIRITRGLDLVRDTEGATAEARVLKGIGKCLSVGVLLHVGGAGAAAQHTTPECTALTSVAAGAQVPFEVGGEAEAGAQVPFEVQGEAAAGAQVPYEVPEEVAAGAGVPHGVCEKAAAGA